jgi:hypothetical protein
MPNKGYPGANEGERAETGEKEPKGAKSSDPSGTKSKGKINGVGIGQADKAGNSVQGVGRSGMGAKEHGEYNTGRSESTCYNHKRVSHPQD